MGKHAQQHGAEGARPLRNASPEPAVRLASLPAAPGPGIHRVHKPVGASSHACLRDFLGLPDGVARGEQPACHGGTLDPFAEGLLLVLMGGATRVMTRLHALPKVYVAELAWGAETDTGDAGGVVVARADGLPARDAVEGALAGFRGWTEQVPPATSAKRIDGERAYVRAHRGELVTLPPSRVYLHDVALTAWDGPSRRATLCVTCAGGYYVRALARDLGRAVGCPAHLVGLRRTSIGPWNDPGRAPGGPPTIRAASGPDLLPWLPSRVLTASEHGRLVQGGTIALGSPSPPRWRLPHGFPEPAAGVVGLVGTRAVAVLVEEAGFLRTETALRGGA